MIKLKNNKGITLVALVVTIIILLILAGITISQLSGSGLFENAKLAEQKSKEAQEKEDKILSDYENNINKYISNSRDTETNGEYFYNSFNGFQKVKGEATTHSLYGLTGTQFEVEGENSWSNCIYEKTLDNSFDLSGEFEISFKHRLTTTSSSQTGQFKIDFINAVSNSDENSIFFFWINDAWTDYSKIGTISRYNEANIYNKQETSSNRYCTYAVIGDGTTIKFYRDDELLATTEQIPNLSINKISITFQKQTTYEEGNKNYLERLYIGDIKYYKDIIK